MVTKQKIFTDFKFSETLKGISNALQSLKFVQPNVNEIAWGRGRLGQPPPPPPLGIKCVSEKAWYKKDKQ